VSPLRRDAAWTALTLLALLLWEASGADMAVMRLFADARGFALRDHWLLAQGLHGGGRVLSWALLAVLVADTWRPFTGGAPGGPGGPRSPPRRERLFWLAVVLAAAVIVPALKRASLTSCPWDLAEFGGVARYVPHWLVGVSDGGPGHCFPSGHAAGVLAFIGVYFLWRPYQPQRARQVAAAVWLLGAVYGTVQVLRGAHLPSHVLWAAWLCWTIAAGANAARLAFSRRKGLRPPAAPVATNPGASRPLR